MHFVFYVCMIVFVEHAFMNEQIKTSNWSESRPTLSKETHKKKEGGSIVVYVDIYKLH